MISKAKILIAAIVFFVLAGNTWLFFLSAPKGFPSSVAIVIEKGTGLAEISNKLKKEEFIRSKYAFALYARAFNKSKKIKYGKYLFNEPVSVFALAGRLTKGEFGFKPIKVTVAEGLTAKEISELFGDFENFDKEEFWGKTINLEGYLFPDTYLFLPFAETEQIIGTMTDNFKKKAGNVGKDIVIMASLIEKEVPDSGDRKIISGILWKRLELGMALQVDAVFPYITGSRKILSDDLKIDSLYNTYLYKGLPPGPISNPGLDAIDAARNPQETPYLYYLSGNDGKTHFAKTFAEHLRNKEKYLK
ncbi:MAG: hypothetical protein A2Z62_00850 [Candidatus Terrybacteria bacterium RIFCSPLOWO2_02_42_20]|uniref:Endolytic murein transglycosylase n=1 Tax=Candidatus Terrybacteria bacterium RIFCSPLOWO2_02_42_20 TaxID=1802370 RepID=A0A1G2Q1I5_9BACT|nr:MAG: hypothetical protein A2Z62_00850 [Candidatus Terrybacteria bacterium RIFCSPLOWO2_02_42_20]